MVPICDKFITTSEFNICSETIFDERLKQTNLVVKFNIANKKVTSNKSKNLDAKNETNRSINFFSNYQKKFVSLNLFYR